MHFDRQTSLTVVETKFLPAAGRLLACCSRGSLQRPFPRRPGLCRPSCWPAQPSTPTWRSTFERGRSSEDWSAWRDSIRQTCVAQGDPEIVKNKYAFENPQLSRYSALLEFMDSYEYTPLIEQNCIYSMTLILERDYFWHYFRVALQGILFVVQGDTEIVPKVLPF